MLVIRLVVQDFKLIVHCSKALSNASHMPVETLHWGHLGPYSALCGYLLGFAILPFANSLCKVYFLGETFHRGMVSCGHIVIGFFRDVQTLFCGSTLACPDCDILLMEFAFLLHEFYHDSFDVVVVFWVFVALLRAQQLRTWYAHAKSYFDFSHFKLLIIMVSLYHQWDLNPHSRNGQRILSPSCLPFHHDGI